MESLDIYSDEESIKSPTTPNALAHEKAHEQLDGLEQPHSIFTPDSQRFKRPRHRLSPLKTSVLFPIDHTMDLDNIPSPGDISSFEEDDYKIFFGKHERGETVKSDDTLVEQEMEDSVGDSGTLVRSNPMKSTPFFSLLSDGVIDTFILPLLSIQDASHFSATCRRFYHLEFLDFKHYSSLSDLLSHALMEEHESIKQTKLSKLTLQRIRNTYNQPPFDAMSQDEMELFIRLFVKKHWDHELFSFLNYMGLLLAGKSNIVSHGLTELRHPHSEQDYYKHESLRLVLDATAQAAVRYKRPELLKRLLQVGLVELDIIDQAEILALPISLFKQPEHSIESNLTQLFIDTEVEEVDTQILSIHVVVALLSKNEDKINQMVSELVNYRLDGEEESVDLRPEMQTDAYKSHIQNLIQGGQKELNEAVKYLKKTFELELYYPEPTGAIPNIGHVAIVMDRLDLLKALWSITWDDMDPSSASMEQLQQAADTIDLVLDAAAKRGRVAIFDYFWPFAQTFGEIGIPGHLKHLPRYLSSAIQYGRLEMTRYLLSIKSIYQMAMLGLFRDDQESMQVDDDSLHPMDEASLLIFDYGVKAIQSMNSKMIQFVFSNAFAPDIDIQHDISSQVPFLIRQGASAYLIQLLMAGESGLWMISSQPSMEWLLSAAEGDHPEMFDLVLQYGLPITRQVLEMGRLYDKISLHALNRLGTLDHILMDGTWPYKIEILRKNAFTEWHYDQYVYLLNFESLVDMYTDTNVAYPLACFYMTTTWLPNEWVHQGIFYDILGMLARKDYVNLANQVLAHMHQLSSVYPPQDVLAWLLKTQASSNLMESYLRIYNRHLVTNEEIDLALDAFHQAEKRVRAFEVLRCLLQRNPQRQHTIDLQALQDDLEQRPLDDDLPFETPLN